VYGDGDPGAIDANTGAVSRAIAAARDSTPRSARRLEQGSKGQREGSSERCGRQREIGVVGGNAAAAPVRLT
jgi:hypothetical protein